MAEVGVSPQGDTESLMRDTLQQKLMGSPYQEASTTESQRAAECTGVTHVR